MTVLSRLLVVLCGAIILYIGVWAATGGCDGDSGGGCAAKVGFSIVVLIVAAAVVLLIVWVCARVGRWVLNGRA